MSSVKISVSVLCYPCVYIGLGDAALATIRVLKMGHYCDQNAVLQIAQNGLGAGEGVDIPTGITNAKSGVPYGDCRRCLFGARPTGVALGAAPLAEASSRISAPAAGAATSRSARSFRSPVVGSPLTWLGTSLLNPVA